MCENLHYDSVYFKELHNQQEYYWPTIYRTGAAVVSAITSWGITESVRIGGTLFSYIFCLIYAGLSLSDLTIKITSFIIERVSNISNPRTFELDIQDHSIGFCHAATPCSLRCSRSFRSRMDMSVQPNICRVLLMSITIGRSQKHRHLKYAHYGSEGANCTCLKS